MKRKTLSFINRCLAAVLAMLGFQACEKYMVCLYGSPHADYVVKGKVTNTEKEPIQNIQVVVDKEHWKDTVYTDEKGEYQWAWDGFPRETNVKVVANDTTGRYASDSTTVEFSFDRSKADGWYEGVGTAEADFELKKK